MSRCMLFAVALIAAPAFAQPFAPDRAAPPSPEMPPAQLLAQFHHDQINLLALRTDARSLLSAALMAQTDADDLSRPKALQTPALVARAQKFNPDNTLTWWVSAALECAGKTRPCPSDATLQQLEKVDASNAATWLWLLARAQQSADAPTARAALTSAAQSARFDDYFGTLVSMLDEASAILPVSQTILRASDQLDAGPAGFRLTYAAGLAANLPRPYREALASACADTASDAALAADCIAVAQKLADCGSLAARGFGLRLLLQLNPHGVANDAVVARARSLAWRNLQIGTLAARLTGDARITGVYLHALALRGSEIDAVDAVLQLAGVALEPPAAWQVPAAESTPAQ